MELTFEKDLVEGKRVEEQVLNILKKHFSCATMIEGACKDYDIWIPERTVGVEVKSCPSCHDYGNIVIEIEMFGKPSGLLRSKAGYWVIYDGTKFQLMTREDILHCIFINKLTYREFVGKGDAESKKAFLVPATQLMKYGKEIK